MSYTYLNWLAERKLYYKTINLIDCCQLQILSLQINIFLIKMSASNIIEYPLIKSSATVVGTTDWDELDRELAPILTELVTLGPCNDQHPSVRQLFGYLMNPECTGEELSYVIGELAFEVSGESMYLTKVAAETLAVRSPVLTGSWEVVAWLHF